MATARSVRQPALAERAAQEEPNAEEVLQEAEAAFGEIFSVRAPRDVLAGVWSGIKCVLSGVLLGVAGAISQPIQGAQEGGLAGCFKGCAIGILTGFFFSFTGLCTGVFQAVRGVVATPRAICMASKGWRWDAEAGAWAEPKVYSLPEEAETILRSGGAAGEEEDDDGHSPSGAQASARRKVADTYYYDQLGVPPTAAQNDIRRAYFQLSRRWHPDKASEPDAKEKFQAISAAYQVLSDPERRRSYDARGREGAGEGFIDPKVFFTVLIGADALAPYIGQLRLAEMFGEELFGRGSEADPADTLGDFTQRRRDLESSESRQVKRQIRLAVRLAGRLDGRAELGQAFFASAREEARGILHKDASLEPLVAEIGFVYKNRAEEFLAKRQSRLGSFGARAVHLRFQGRSRQATQQAQTAKLAVRSFLELRRIVSAADANAKEPQATAEEEELPPALMEALPTFYETFWSLSSHDITGTLDRVIERVLGDNSVDAAGQCRRAEALSELGEAFLAEARALQADAAKEGGVGNDQQKCRRFEEAFIASVGGGAATAR